METPGVLADLRLYVERERALEPPSSVSERIGEYRCGPRETWNEVVDARALANRGRRPSCARQAKGGYLHFG